ncbi:MAG: hypothetical protein NTU45_09900, partial [Planctomycetota bacterium]|nr:hypothetical protein [Planctomycetota bacterium]
KTDTTLAQNASGKKLGQPGYNPDADWDRDGTVTTRDVAQYGSTAYVTALPQGQLAPAASVSAPLSAANARSDFNIGFCGYRFNGDIGAYTVRFRHYDPTPGMCRWLERDPAGYQDGPSLYSYLGRNPMAGTDPYGLFYSGSGITVIAPDQIRPPVGASELVNPPGYGLRPTLLPPGMPGNNEVLAWAEALSAIAKSNAERGVDFGGGAAGFVGQVMAFYIGMQEGQRDGAILIANSFACGWVPGLNDAADQVRTANASSTAYTVSDWSATVGTTLLPIGGTLKFLGFGAKAAKGAKAAGGGVEVVQRAMSLAELEATVATGLIRGGRSGTHYVSNAVNKNALRARQRLALNQTPQVRVTMEVPRGVFSPPSAVRPMFRMPGGGMERIATGDVPVRILGIQRY